jgi:uroporphyrinogen decarboxylase
MSLTQLELFNATVNHQKHDKVLFYAAFTPDLDRRISQKYKLDDSVNLVDYFGMFRPEQIIVPHIDSRNLDFDQYYENVDKPKGTHIDDNGVLHIPGSMYHFTHYISPLRDATAFEQIESFPYKNFSSSGDDDLSKLVQQTHKQGRVATSWVGHMYEDSWQIRGYEQFLMDMAAQSEWCEFILDKVTKRNMFNATAAAKAGVDYIMTGDDVACQNNMIFSLENWRKFIKPRWSEVYAAAREIKPDIQIWYHSDGNIADIIPELIEIGVTILNPIQPECLDPIAVKKQYGDKIVMDGTIGTQTTMPFGSIDDVRGLIRNNVSKLGYDGALILSPTHVLEPEVPLENIEAFIETAKSM